MTTTNVQRCLGIDIGSTTAKIVLAEGSKILYQKYERHYSQVRNKTLELIEEIQPMLEDGEFLRSHFRLGRTGRGRGCQSSLYSGGIRHR